MDDQLLIRRTRRAVLAGAVGGAAALAVEAARPRGVAAANGSLILATENTSNGPTSVAHTGIGPAFKVQTPAGNAIVGSTAGFGGVGLAGFVEGEESTAVVGGATSATGETYGCIGQVLSPDGIALMGWHTGSGTAVSGYTGTTDATVPVRPNTGVLGIATEGGTDARGVVGQVTHGQGVRGEATDGIAGFFRSETGSGIVSSVGSPVQVALQTNGGLQFRNRSGRARVAKGRASVTVAAPGVTTDNFAIATLASDRSGIFVRAVICRSGLVQILLNRSVGRATRVSWLVLG